MLHYFLKYWLSLLVICGIIALSLLPVSQPEMIDVPFADKWAHTVMYGGLTTVLWVEYAWKHTHFTAWRIWILCALLPLTLSGTMELMQAYCTTTRSGEWLDMLANTLGVLLGMAFGYYAVRPAVKKIRK